MPVGAFSFETWPQYLRQFGIGAGNFFLKLIATRVETNMCDYIDQNPPNRCAPWKNGQPWLKSRRSSAQTSPRPPIATVSQTALTASSHTALNSPRRACTPLSRLRTSSTALVVVAIFDPVPPAAAAAVADEGAIDLGRRRGKRRNIASAGSNTNRMNNGTCRR
jgi:hypothetical protein